MALGSDPTASASGNGCHEPITAQALNARRWAITKTVADKGKAENRVTEMDVWGEVVRAGIRNTDDNRTDDLQLASYAKEHCSVAMCTFLFQKPRQVEPADR